MTLWLRTLQTLRAANTFITMFALASMDRNSWLGYAATATHAFTIIDRLSHFEKSTFKSHVQEISLPMKCWLNERIRGTNVSTSCSPLSSSDAVSMDSITKSRNDSLIWSTNANLELTEHLNTPENTRTFFYLPYNVNGTTSPVENIIVNNKAQWHCITGSVIKHIVYNCLVFSQWAPCKCTYHFSCSECLWTIL